MIICVNPKHEKQGAMRKGSNLHKEHIKNNKGKCKEEEYNPIKHNSKSHCLKNLIEIEDPNMMNELVNVKAIVSSNTISYSVPSKIRVNCYNDDDNHSCKSQKEIEIVDIDKVGFTDISETARVTRCKTISKNNGFNKNCQLKIDELEPSTIKKIRVRPIMSILEDKNGKLVDISGNEWKSYDIYIKEDNLKPFEAGKEIQITGFVIVEPKNQKITLIASSAEKTEDYLPDYTKINKLSDFVKNKSISKICDWITTEFTNYSKIIKRENITISSLLTFFSPIYFEFESKKINGWVKMIIIGDSTTGKSQTVSQLIEILKNGQMVSGETSSMAGLGATATQSTNSQWFVEYGPLVLQDRKLLSIDGAHKLNMEQWASLAEAERTGMLKITKAAKGEAHARTRQIKIMNPVGDDYRTTRPMKSFFHSVQSIENSLQIQSIARQDLSIFVNDDVSSESINAENKNKYDVKLEYYSELLKLCWNNQYKIIIEKSAYDEILVQSIRLEKKFKCEEIPLITNDQKYKLAKLSIALASIMLSFDNNFRKLTVTKDHVRYISDFIETEYHNAGLDIIANNLNDNVDSEQTAETVYKIKEVLSKKDDNIENVFCKDILIWTAQQTRFTNEQLKTKFDLPENSKARPLLALMQTEKLLTQKGGFSPTKKLIDIGKMLISKTKLGGVSTFDPVNPVNPVKNPKSYTDLYNKQATLTDLTDLTVVKQDTPPNVDFEDNTIITNDTRSKIRSYSRKKKSSKSFNCKECSFGNFLNLDFKSILDKTETIYDLHKKANPKHKLKFSDEVIL